MREQQKYLLNIKCSLDMRGVGPSPPPSQDRLAVTPSVISPEAIHHV